jgi:hypothetical protein
MGLDMYLYREVYIGAEYEHRKIEGKIDITSDGKPIKVNFKKVSSIKETVGYWRKANQIHHWFVQNVQDGEDNCASYYVSEGKLQELLEETEKVLASKGTPQEEDVVNEFLPSSDGFFFGSDYKADPEWYWLQMENTKEILTEVLAEKYDDDQWVSYYYQSSW